MESPAQSRDGRVFLGWDRPALASAAEILIERRVGERSGVADFSSHHVCVPTARAGRLITAALVDEAASRGVALTPPLTPTPGELPSVLLGPPGREAPELERRLAFAEALRRLPARTAERLVPHAAGEPFAGDLAARLRFGDLIRDASDRLAGAGLRFAQVPDRAGGLLPEDEEKRWIALAEVQVTAERILRGRGFVDGALATAEMVMSGRVGGAGGAAGVTLSLVGVPTLGVVQRRAIELSGVAVTPLVFAPVGMEERFDELGCVVEEAWSERPIDVPDERIVFVGDAEEQAHAALASLGGGGTVEVTDAVVGIADPEAVSAVRRVGELSGAVRVRTAIGTPTTQTRPGRFVSAMHRFTRERSFGAFAALFRHPDAAALLNQAGAGEEVNGSIGTVMRRLDEIEREHLPVSIGAVPDGVRREATEALRAARDGAKAALGSIVNSPGADRPARRWAADLRTALRCVYGGVALDPARPEEEMTLVALENIRDAIAELEAVDEATGDRIELDASAALGLIVDRLERMAIPEPPSADAIDAVGWPDLALDPAHRCVVVGMDESHVPASRPHDPLMPESLRRALGVDGDAERYARDSYLFNAIAGSRDATFVATRRAATGDPATPSRLLFRCSGRALAERVARFTDEDAGPGVRVQTVLSAGDVDEFATPLRFEAGYTPPAEMRVTDFDRYLASPAAWYLERHLGLEECTPPPFELTRPRLGTFVHAVLHAFHRDGSAAEARDAGAISRALHHHLGREAERRFGAEPAAAVAVQIELLRYRLRFFASHEAQRRAAGWRTLETEWSPGAEGGAAIDAASGPMPLRGRIDRIDVNDATGRWALIDYKTGTPPDAEKHHRRSSGWRRLQLPLYRTLAQPLATAHGLDEAALELCLAGFPGDADEKAWSVAMWSAEELDAADGVASGIVDEIRGFRPGTPVPLGDSPPAEGALGFVTGARYASGALVDDREGGGVGDDGYLFAGMSEGTP